MSVEALECKACAIATKYERVAPFPISSSEASYGVAWVCPKCGGRSLDVCPTGPIEVTEQSCLNCGNPLDDDKCAACGVSREEAFAFLHVESPPASIEDTKAVCEKGLIRRALANINRRLQLGESAADWQQKGAIYQQIGFHVAAATAYRRSLSLADDHQVKISLACEQYDLGNIKEAVAIYDSLIAKTTDDLVLEMAYANRGNAHAALKEFEVAADDYREAIRRGPERASNYLNFALIYSSRKMWDVAREVAILGLHFVKGFDRVPLLIEKARTANEQELADMGLTAADEALAVAPKDIHALYQRAWALGMLGRLQEAHVTLRRLLDLDPDSASGKAALAKIEAVLPHQSKPPWWKVWK